MAAAVVNGVICGTNPQSAHREPFSNGSRVVQVQLAPRGLRQKRRVNGVTFGSNLTIADNEKWRAQLRSPFFVC